MASLDVRDELDCSICLGIYTDPVTLPCGHNFCKGCITMLLEKQKESGVYSCPECREEFKEMTSLLRNITLCNIAERFLSAQPALNGNEVFCTYCDSSVPAVKTCLLCEASLCGKHLKKHRNSPEHVLVDPTTSLENRKCPIHKEVFKYYCAGDSTCICVTCRLDGNHQTHQVDSLDNASEKKKQALRNLLPKMTSSRAETEKTVQKLHAQMKDIQDKAAGKTKRVTAIFRDLRTQLDDLEKSVLTRISEQEKQMTCSISDLIKQMEIEMDELLRRMRRIEELCDLTDALTVLQESNRKEFFDVGKKDCNVGEDYLKIVHAAGNLDETVIIEILHAKFSDSITTTKKDIYIPRKSYKLDGNTAAKSLRLSLNGKRAEWIKPAPGSSCADSPGRFQDCSQVLSTLCFSSSRNFWETETSDCGEWRLGVCYSTIDKKGDTSYLGCNNKSWCLSKSSNNRYSVIHDRREIIISHNISCNRFRVSLDYEAGQVSFYELCSPIRHLHTLSATFTEPLYAAFYVFGSNAFVRITT
ncbi:PREDICTED: E3 ubiquitin-protein ligase Midline-1-like [Nanorana parkeri]|uniref:E3 ubiquitin-protein ligase Midline-1-like n=1 Tax=Nanorana parkeri TaxID=125878 RepID=UPI00085457FF|nr:PREDICTED: E3 ubiquitin-protein ligase Midline-1-like [Nanorana parkeri]